MAQFRMDPLRTLAFGSIGAAYVAVGTPLTRPALIVWFDNLTDADIILSFDGVNDHLCMPAQSGKVVDISSDKNPQDSLASSVGTYFHIKQDSGAPTSGSFCISIGYAR